MTKALVTGIGLALAIPLALAAQNGIATRVGDSKFTQPQCKLDGGDFRVSSGKTYLKTGIEGTGDPSNRARALNNGVRVVTEAITSSQSKSSAAWYWLGRLYLQQGDLVGADSAFNRTVSLASECKDEIGKLRYRAWVNLVNAGAGFRQSKNDDSSVVMYGAANIISSSDPLAYVNLAELYDAKGNADSSLTYYGRAAATEPVDTNQVKVRNQAAFNYGVLLLKLATATTLSDTSLMRVREDAVIAFRRYVTLDPADMAGKKGLAQAFRAAGMADSAAALESQLVAAAGPATAAGDAEGVSEGDLMDIAVRQFNDKNYQAAAETFGRIATMSPFNRDALFNQANAYLALQDGAKLSATAEKLIGLEPLAEYDHSLRAEGYKITKQQDQLYQAIVTREALPVNLEIETTRLGGTRATVTGKLTGREPRDEANKVLPPHPMTLKMEFLSKDGQVVTTTEVAIPALKPGETAPFEAVGEGSGIKAWRYTAR
jgi:tetratricopeptide (TPR) repeat protein